LAREEKVWSNTDGKISIFAGFFLLSLERLSSLSGCISWRRLVACFRGVYL